MRVYDEGHSEWRKFYGANIVDIGYKPFDATNWTEFAIRFKHQ